MAGKSKQQKMKEQFNAMFAGMEPIEPAKEPTAEQAAEPAAEQPKKKRGRPKKAEAMTEEEKKRKLSPTYYDSKKKDPDTVLIEVTETTEPIISRTVNLQYPKQTEPTKSHAVNVQYKKGTKEPEPKKSERKAAFSVWIDKTVVEDTKQYSAISGEKMTDIVEAALNDFLKAHKLTKKQKDDYKQRVMMKLNDI